MKWVCKLPLTAIFYNMSEDGIVMVAMEIGENLGLVLLKVGGAFVQGHGMFAVGGHWKRRMWRRHELSIRARCGIMWT